MQILVYIGRTKSLIDFPLTRVLKMSLIKLALEWC